MWPMRAGVKSSSLEPRQFAVGPELDKVKQEIASNPLLLCAGITPTWK